MFVTICNGLVIDLISVFSKKIKSFLSGLLTLILIFNLSFAFLGTSAQAVNRSQINALKQQQEQLEKKKAEVQAQADANNSKVMSQTQKLNNLTAKLNVTNSELQNLSKQIAVYTNTIAEMENELNVDEQKQQKLMVKYKQRMRVMEENGTISYIGIVLGASSFTDLLGRIDCVKEIMDYDSGLIRDVRDAEAKVKNAKADMEDEMADQQKVFSSYKEKEADLMAQQKEAQDILSSLKSDSADYAQQLSSVKSLQSSISGQIGNMESKLKEQERIKAEQAAADKITSDKSNWYSDAGSGSGSGQDIVNYAKQFLGVPYVYGGTSPSGFDCSGLVFYCYRHFGYSVNRTASSLAFNGSSVSASALKPGDIILFSAEDGGYIGHTGIYIGGGQFIHAPHTGDVVKISSLSESYYRSHFWGARRVIP